MQRSVSVRRLNGRRRSVDLDACERLAMAGNQIAIIALGPLAVQVDAAHRLGRSSPHRQNDIAHRSGERISGPPSEFFDGKPTAIFRDSSGLTFAEMIRGGRLSTTPTPAYLEIPRDALVSFMNSDWPQGSPGFDDETIRQWAMSPTRKTDRRVKPPRDKGFKGSCLEVIQAAFRENPIGWPKDVEIQKRVGCRSTRPVIEAWRLFHQSESYLEHLNAGGKPWGSRTEKRDRKR